ncbi:MAG: glutathione S-transferase N-terminal domain-containing protein [Betaproteobacteria bacterium]
MKFYGAAVSGNAFKVRILLELLHVPFEKQLIDFTKREHKAPEFLRLNPRGEVPVIEDGGAVI